MASACTSGKKCLVVNIKATGHINPTLVLVEELICRGYTVHYACYAEMRARCEGAGAVFHAIAEEGWEVGKVCEMKISEVPAGPVRASWFKMALMNAVQHLLPRMKEIVRSIEPDFIVSDTFSPWGKCIGKILEIPVITSVSSYPSTPNEHISVSPEPFCSMIEKAVADTVALEPSLDGYFVAEDGMNAMTDFAVVYSRELAVPSSSPTGPPFHFIGPATLAKSMTPDPTFPWDELTAPGRRVVYLSLGTVVGDTEAAHVMPLLLRGLCTVAESMPSGEELFLVWSHGAVEVDESWPLPPLSLVRKSVPQVELLRRACACFVTHCGFNSYNEALLEAAPMVCVPVFADQPVNAARAVELGVGVLLELGSVTAEEVSSGVREVLTDGRFKKNALGLQEEMQRGPGVKEGVDAIEAYVAEYNKGTGGLSQ